MCVQSPEQAGDEEYTLPCVEALLAGTLALMTGVAQAAPGSDHVAPMAIRIVDNLGALADHPALSAPMRLMLARLLPRWQPLAQQALLDDLAVPERALWFPSPSAVQ